MHVSAILYMIHRGFGSPEHLLLILRIGLTQQLSLHFRCNLDSGNYGNSTGRAISASVGHLLMRVALRALPLLMSEHLNRKTIPLTPVLR